MSVQYGSSQSGWRSMAWSANPRSDTWGHAVPTLIGLGTRAAPQFVEAKDEPDPELVDWDWNELEEFANRVENTP